MSSIHTNQSEVAPVAPITAGRHFWRQQSLFQKHWVLLTHHVPAAVLTVERGGTPSVSVETVNGSWHITRQGAVRHQVIIQDSEGNPAGYAESGPGGTTTITLFGRVYTWAPANFWRSRWELKDAQTNDLLEAETIASFMRRESSVDITHTGAACQDIALLVPLTWYLLMKEKNDREARLV